MHGFAMRLLQNLMIPTFVVDLDCKVMIWNTACERLTGVWARDVVLTGQHWSAFYEAPRPCLADLIIQGRVGELASLYPGWDGRGITEFGVSIELGCRLPKVGRMVDLAIDAGPIYDQDGKVIAAVETVRDITAQKEIQNTLHNLATLDGLTGLANRRRFDVAIEAEAARCSREGRDLALLMIDVDCFKSYNDTYGHLAGDACLRAVAEVINGVLRRDGEMTARYGGEEFVVLLPESNGSRAERVAGQMMDAVAALDIPHASSTAAPIVSISVGVAALRGREITARAMLTGADEALYFSKRCGRNRVTVSGMEAALTLF